MNHTSICTIIAKNYLAHARVLAESFLRHHPGGTVYALLCDRLDGYFNPAEEPFVTVQLDELYIPDLAAMTFKYDIVELSTAVKPFLLRYLLASQHLDRLCYFDPDILFLSPVEAILAALDSHNIVLTPHLIVPQRHQTIPTEQMILTFGTYNLGFLGLSASAETGRFLDWWADKLTEHCTIEPEKGLYVDQRWIDLVPGMFEGVHIVREPGYNIAYWNLAERPLVQRDDGYFCQDERIRFFHFSGFSPMKPDSISGRVRKDDARLSMAGVGDAAELFRKYADCLLGRGFEGCSRWPYAFGAFDNGVPIPRLARRLWRERPQASLVGSDPFVTGAQDSFYRWLTYPVDSRWPMINRLAERVYLARPDIQKAFPDAFGTRRRDFARWFVETGIHEHGIGPELVDGMRASLDATASSVERNAGRLQPLVARAKRSMLGRRLLGSRLAQTARQVIYPSLTRSPRSVLTPSAPIPGDKVQPASAPGLNIIGYLSAETGVGEVPRALARALVSAGYPVAVTHLDNPDGARRNDLSGLELPSGMPYDASLFAVNADGMVRARQTLGPEWLAGRANIGYWFWEIGRFPTQWLDRFADLSEVWVGCAFAQVAVGAVSPVPVVNMGAPVVLRAPSDVTRRELGVPEDKFVFLFAFDMLSVPERKNPLDCVAAYRRAFEPRFEDTCLVLKANHLARFPEWRDRLREDMASVHGILIEETLDRSQVNALLGHADTYVSLHRSEGFGLTLAESMRMGKPVIATDYSANRDYLNNTNGYPVQYTLVELERDYGPYQAGNVWAQPDIDHAAELMRRVLTNPEECVRKGRRAAQDIERDYGAEAFADRVAQRLSLQRR